MEDLEIEKLKAEIRFKNAEAAFKEAEANRNNALADTESLREEEMIVTKIKCLSALLLDQKPGMFFDSFSTNGTSIFEDEDDRELIRQKILSLIKKM